MAHPVPNKVLYVEIVKSLEHDELTPKALRLLQKQAKHLSYTKFSYVREADRDDVIAFGLFDVIKYWLCPTNLCEFFISTSKLFIY